MSKIKKTLHDSIAFKVGLIIFSLSLASIAISQSPNAKLLHAEETVQYTETLSGPDWYEAMNDEDKDVIDSALDGFAAEFTNFQDDVDEAEGLGYNMHTVRDILNEVEEYTTEHPEPMDEADFWDGIDFFNDALDRAQNEFHSVVNQSAGSTPPAGYEKPVITVSDNPFPDTDINELEGKAAADLYHRAVIGGYPDGEFKGNFKVNRAEAAKFLLLAAGTDVRELKNNRRFGDVLEGQWYVKYVITAAENGIIGGYPDGTFKPANTVNTAEFLKMLSLAFGAQLNLPYSYSDVPGDAWFAPYAGIAQAYNLFPGRSTYLMPARELSRRDVAIAIYQYLNGGAPVSTSVTTPNSTDYLDDCAKLTASYKEDCSKAENWLLDITVTKNGEVISEELAEGDNKCFKLDGANIKSDFLDINVDGDEILCNAQCTTWSCQDAQVNEPPVDYTLSLSAEREAGFMGNDDGVMIRINQQPKIEDNHVSFDFLIGREPALTQSVKVLLFDSSAEAWVYGFGGNATTQFEIIPYDAFSDQITFDLNNVEIESGVLNDLSAIDAEKGYLLDIETNDGRHTLVGQGGRQLTMAEGQNPKELAWEVPGFTLCDDLFDCEGRSLNVFEALQKAFGYQGVNLTETYIQNYKDEDFRPVMECPDSQLITMVFAKDLQVLPNYKEAHRRYNKCQVKQDPGKYLMNFSIWTECVRGDFTCDCGFSIRMFDLTEGPASDSYLQYSNQPVNCSTSGTDQSAAWRGLPEEINDFLETVEIKYKQQFKDEDGSRMCPKK